VVALGTCRTSAILALSVILFEVATTWAEVDDWLSTVPVGLALARQDEFIWTDVRAPAPSPGPRRENATFRSRLDTYVLLDGVQIQGITMNGYHVEISVSSGPGCYDRFIRLIANHSLPRQYAGEEDEATCVSPGAPHILNPALSPHVS